jgi:hypothetical protein
VRRAFFSGSGANSRQRIPIACLFSGGILIWSQLIVMGKALRGSVESHPGCTGRYA